MRRNRYPSHAPIHWLVANWRGLVLSRDAARRQLRSLDCAPAGRGVYLLIEPGNMDVRYVGSSVNVNRRCRDHAEAGGSGLMACSIPVPEMWRLGLEGCYIEALAPSGNTRSPGGLPDVPMVEAILAAWTQSIASSRDVNTLRAKIDKAKEPK